MAVTGNPYATSTHVGGQPPNDPTLQNTQSDVPHQEYATAEPPSDTNKWYLRVLGWSARLNRNETPDPHRANNEPGNYFAVEGNPPEEFYEKNRGAELLRRHGVEDQDADGWREQKDRLRRAPDPRWTPVPESEGRPTLQMSPNNYSFTRPFDQQNRSGSRHFNGLHFSMADNIRQYPILGMKPPRHTTRNTYRIDPTPWDADIVDMPADTNVVAGRIIAVDVAPPGNRSWRL